MFMQQLRAVPQVRLAAVSQTLSAHKALVDSHHIFYAL